MSEQHANDASSPIDASFDVDRAILSLWGKSQLRGAPRPHRLLQHLFDTLAVGEVMWDRYLADGVRAAVDAACAGNGRRFFALLCGLHDLGKATPKFQSKDSGLAARTRAAGLGWGTLSTRRGKWHHTVAGSVILRDYALDVGWDSGSVNWVWPMIGGHHGAVPPVGWLRVMAANDDHGQHDPRWAQVQRGCVDLVLAAAGYRSLAAAEPNSRPTPGQQLAISGLIIMADWLASNSSACPPIDDPNQVGMEAARGRAPVAWESLDLRGGWVAHTYPDNLMQFRFDRLARPLQSMVQGAAESMSEPGIMVIEAPMGEGKTEAALVATEILACRFGNRGLFIGMPTQATSDPMFDRMQRWSTRVAPNTPVVLLHGKRMFNQRFRKLSKSVSIDDITGNEDPFLTGSYRPPPPVVQWFLEAKRGLLSPMAVGTIDQLLFAGTRTSHVMLRHTGLAGKVVVLDEVHAATTYMSQFLQESLRWLGSAGTPVVLLTATLPPVTKQDLVRAYLSGAGIPHEDDMASPFIDGYPSVYSACVADGVIQQRGDSCAPWRPDLSVDVQLLADEDDVDGELTAAFLDRELAEGGCAVVIRNTVQRAQQTYQALLDRFGADVELLHGRLTVAERARRTERELERLGPNGTATQRHRHVLVATQVAEQSFDVDADLMISDLAPIDLLLQRAGRLHRHDRDDRPAAVGRPRLVVSGLTLTSDAPTFPGGAVSIYGSYRLLVSADLVLQARDGAGWLIPGDVPGLVAAGYAERYVPRQAGWLDDIEVARSEDDAARKSLRGQAEEFLLNPAGTPLPLDLRRLGEGKTTGDDDTALQAKVRDGDESIEALLVLADEQGDHVTLSGRRLTTGGALTASDDVVEEAVGSVVRLPAYCSAAFAPTPVPTAWEGAPLLRSFRPLVLDAERRARVGRASLRYDDRLGLLTEARPP